jgi:hypothetical protein
VDLSPDPCDNDLERPFLWAPLAELNRQAELAALVAASSTRHVDRDAAVELSPDPCDNDLERPSVWAPLAAANRQAELAAIVAASSPRHVVRDAAMTQPADASLVAASYPPDASGMPLDAMLWPVIPIVTFCSGGAQHMSKHHEHYQANKHISNWASNGSGARKLSDAELTDIFREVKDLPECLKFDLVYNVYGFNSPTSKLASYHNGLHPDVMEPTMQVAIDQGFFQRVLDDICGLWDKEIRAADENDVPSLPNPDVPINVLFLGSQGYDIYNGILDIL